MNPDKLVSLSAIPVLIAASTGQLPKLIVAVRKAQIQLIQDTKSSNWGMPILLRSK
jgi:recombinational DNA repair ATPase RecF